jgi:hypothetical protein
VSNAAGSRGRPVVPAEWDRLELGVRRLLDDQKIWRRRARTAEERVAELEATMRDLSTGALDPSLLSGRIQTLEEENRSLRQRVDLAREAVRRVLGRLQFLEDDR